MHNYLLNLFSVKTSYHRCFWKHSLPPHYVVVTDGRFPHPYEPPDAQLGATLFVCMVRLPYFWILSTIRKSYGWIDFLEPGDSFGARLRSAVLFEGVEFDNIVQLWNRYYRAYGEILASRASIEFVRLEDLVQAPEQVIGRLERHLEIKSGVDLQETVERISSRPAKVHGEPCVHGEEAQRIYRPERVPERIALNDREFINRNLSKELMSQFNYPFVSSYEPAPKNESR